MTDMTVPKSGEGRGGGEGGSVACWQKEQVEVKAKWVKLNWNNCY
jgi:hypothetical protein